MGPLHDPVTRYGINYAGTQFTQWDFQNKGTRTSPARLSFVLEVPLCNLRLSIINSVPCDRILQAAHCKKILPLLSTELTELIMLLSFQDVLVVGANIFLRASTFTLICIVIVKCNESGIATPVLKTLVNCNKGICAL